MERKGKLSVVECLRQEQANAVQLYLQYKGYHWNVNGPFFHDLHTMFDENATRVLETVDELAERQRILGFPAEYTLKHLLLSTTLMEEEKLPTNPKGMVEHLVLSHRLMIRELKKGYELADRESDLGTADLCTRLVQIHEKMEWFLRELLESPSPVLEGIGIGPVVSPRKEVPIPTGR
ncbi:MAG: DNA starvation/stationary phase protection protein [Thermoplasmata archaeon]